MVLTNTIINDYIVRQDNQAGRWGGGVDQTYDAWDRKMADWIERQGKTTIFCHSAPVFVGLVICCDRLHVFAHHFFREEFFRPSCRFRIEDPVHVRLARLSGLGPAARLSEPSSSIGPRNLPDSENGHDGSAVHAEICRAGGTLSPASWKKRPLEYQGDRKKTGVPPHDRNPGKKRDSLQCHPGCRRAGVACRLDRRSARGSGDRPHLSTVPFHSKESNERKVCQ